MSVERSVAPDNYRQVELSKNPLGLDSIPLSSVGPRGLARYAKWTKHQAYSVTSEPSVVLFSSLSPLQLEQEYRRIEAMACRSESSLD